MTLIGVHEIMHLVHPNKLLCTHACVRVCVCVCVHACVHVAVEQCPKLVSHWIMPAWVDVCGLEAEAALVVIPSETNTLTKSK